MIYKLRNLINQRRYKLVLSFLTTPNFYSILVGQILNLNRIPVIVSERRIDLPRGPSIIERLSRQFYRSATFIVTNSYYQQDILIDKYPWLRNRISTIYNGLDLQSFVPVLAEPNNVPLKILAIGRVVPQKNVLCLVEALNLLRQREGIHLEVDWIGRQIMQHNEEEYLSQVNYLIQSYDLEREWNWLGLRSDIVDQFHQHDVLVHPSYIEGLPNVICESLACARPVIASDTLDHAKLVKHGERGYLFDPHDPKDLADKIRMFVDLPLGERRKMGERGRKFAEQYLSLDRYVNEYERLFIKFMNS